MNPSDGVAYFDILLAVESLLNHMGAVAVRSELDDVTSAIRKYEEEISLVARSFDHILDVLHDRD